MIDTLLTINKTGGISAFNARKSAFVSDTKRQFNQLRFPNCKEMDMNVLIDQLFESKELLCEA